MKFAGLVLFAALLSLPALCAETPASSAIPIPPPEKTLALLHKEHPRLLASKQDFAKLKNRIKADRQLTAWRDDLQRQAEAILKEAPSRYEIPDGLRLLGVSRQVVTRIYALAMMWQLDGDRRWADRAWQELEAAAAFPDWNPRHFLDTAEMTHGFAIGYDWLYAAWTPEQREKLRQAIVEKGLKPALNCHHNKPKWWPTMHHNWNQVCNGGISTGALALADVEPEIAGELLNLALQSIQLPMNEFEPDGAWGEGPGYWNYATIYNVLFLASLQSALGTDFGLTKMPGFAKTGLFPVYAVKTDGATFNYADAGERMHPAPQLLWFAREYRQPVCSWLQCQFGEANSRFLPALNMLWYENPGKSPQAAGLPLDKYFRKSEVAFFRQSWNDPDGFFVGFKAGDNKVNHSHLDLGTFVFDALGERWARDLGPDNYNLPGYFQFGGQRWTYYRLRAEGHNTLVLNPGNGPDQDPAAATRIIRFETNPQKAFAIADLTPAYAKDAQRVWRGLQVLDRRQLLIQDEVEANKPADAWWFMHTESDVKFAEDGKIALLQQGKKELEARILSPDGAKFTVMEAEPLAASPHPETQGENKGVRKLTIHLAGITNLQLAVLLTPQQGQVGVKTLPKVNPLKEIASSIR